MTLEETPAASAAATPRNPWTTALAAIWITVLSLAAVFGLIGLVSAHPSDYYGSDRLLADTASAIAGELLRLAIILVGIHLAVAGLRWHLDPASRAHTAKAGERRAERMDF